MSALQIIFLSVLSAAILLAFRWGGRDERLAALAVLGATLMTPLVQSYGFKGPETGIVIVDFALFAALAAIAMRSRSFWPIWAAGFQLCALAVHMAAAAMPGIMPGAYAETLVIWSYPVLLALGIGTWLEVRSSRG